MIRINPKSGGCIEVVCGPMFSGKTEELIRRLRRAEIAGQRSLLFKPRIDNRYDDAKVVSHAGIRDARGRRCRRAGARRAGARLRGGRHRRGCSSSTRRSSPSRSSSPTTASA